LKKGPIIRAIAKEKVNFAISFDELFELILPASVILKLTIPRLLSPKNAAEKNFSIRLKLLSPNFRAI
jgi:hypothetical protein